MEMMFIVVWVSVMYVVMLGAIEEQCGFFGIRKGLSFLSNTHSVERLLMGPKCVVNLELG